eukprot:jgi/Tetstr1/440760/TSEL_029068.t1
MADPETQSEDAMLSISRVIAALVLSIATLAAPAALAASKPLVLEDYFRGRAVGTGVFESGIAGVRREFRVVTHGTWNPKTFTLRLREDFQSNSTTAANVETKDGPVAVRFFDTLTLVDRRTLRNTADVMKYGLVIGTVDLTFKK